MRDEKDGVGEAGTTSGDCGAWPGSREAFMKCCGDMNEDGAGGVGTTGGGGGTGAYSS